MKPDEIIVVTGLPRSGTTLMMRMLEAGGVELYYDKSRPLRFIEDGTEYSNYNIILRETNKIYDLIAGDSQWLDDCEGKAVKILSPSKIRIPPGRKYRFVYMDRKPKHIAKSQEKYFRRSKVKGFPDRGPMEQIAMAERGRGLSILKGYPNSKMLVVKFENLISKPLAEGHRVSKFLGLKMDIDSMSKIVMKRPAKCLPIMLEDIIYGGKDYAVQG